MSIHFAGRLMRNVKKYDQSHIGVDLWLHSRKSLFENSNENFTPFNPYFWADVRTFT